MKQNHYRVYHFLKELFAQAVVAGMQGFWCAIYICTLHFYSVHVIVSLHTTYYLYHDISPILYVKNTFKLYQIGIILISAPCSSHAVQIF